MATETTRLLGKTAAAYVYPTTEKIREINDYIVPIKDIYEKDNDDNVVCTCTMLTYDELIPYATDPFWVMIRQITMFIIVLVFMLMFCAACTISIIDYQHIHANNKTDIIPMPIENTTISKIAIFAI